MLDSMAEIKLSIMTRDGEWPPSVINSVANTSLSVAVSMPSPESANCPPDSGLPVAASASESSGLITSHLQMPLQSTRPHPEKPNQIAIQPITTTFPFPAQRCAVKFPPLMSQHQRSQGYRPSLGSMSHRQSHTSHSTPHRSNLVARGLKAVSFPRDCMNWFTSVASINTAKHRETCGLLLGKSKGGRYVVTTLLIPKQHATSVTCAIDEEELVTQFTEERSLITLGWIHTHPTQSCFMSSVDLHMHSGFQRMLPESFAVVCAPNSTPNIGIFRLTDSPGLQTILDCQVTEAFHPHSERAIYTDADKGHVQICVLPLEIVDLREHTASESTDGLIALPSRRRAVALQSGDTLEVVEGSLSRYRHSKAGHYGEGEEEEVVHAARTAGGPDEPISEPETPKQRPAALDPTKTPAQRSNVSHKSTLPSVNHGDGSMQSEAAVNPTPEVFEGFDMLHRPPESQLHDQQPEHLRILQDKFGTPRPDRGHRYSFTDNNSSRNEEDGDYQESLVDPDNESRCSGKTVLKGSLFTPSILSPARSQLTSLFN